MVRQLKKIQIVRLDLLFDVVRLKVRTIRSSKMASALPKQRKSASNFYDCLRPTFAISRGFGLITFSLHLNSDGNLEKTTFGLHNGIRFAASALVNLLLLYLTQYLPKSKKRFETPVLKLTYRLYRFLTYLSVFVAVGLDLFNRKRLLKILKDFTAFDKNVNVIYKQRWFVTL